MEDNVVPVSSDNARDYLSIFDANFSGYVELWSLGRSG